LDSEGIDRMFQRYQAAYRTFDVDALLALYPRLPNDTRKFLKQSRSACSSYELTLTILRRQPGGSDSALVEAQTSYQCVPKTGALPPATQMKEAFWLRRDMNGTWTIDTISAPPVQ
jgi:ketosteroid isomerase-like protein